MRKQLESGSCVLLLVLALSINLPLAYGADPVSTHPSPAAIPASPHHDTSAASHGTAPHDTTATHANDQHGGSAHLTVQVDGGHDKGEGAAHREITVKASANEVSVSCIDPHACCEEASKVIDTLQTMVKALNNGDWKTYEGYLDEHCTTFDESSHKLIAGRDNVLSEMKTKIEKYNHNGSPFVSVTIDHPYAKVTGDTAVVTLVAYRQYGGKHPFKESCKVTDVFVKHEGKWKKCHFRGAWKRV